MIASGGISMNKNLLTIIAGLIMFFSSLLIKIEVGYVLCFIGLVFLGTGILKYFEYNERIGGPLSAASILIGIVLMYIQFNLNNFALGLFVFLLIVLWISNFKYYSKSDKNIKG